jgi:hypothetical protein
LMLVTTPEGVSPAAGYSAAARLLSLLGLVLISGCAAGGGPEPTPTVGPSAALTACALSPLAAIDVSFLNDSTPVFVQYLAQTMLAPPTSEVETSTASYSEAGGVFATGESVGFLNRVAVTGPEGDWPNTPLSGAVVATYPGALEAYQQTMVFQSDTGAEAMTTALESVPPTDGSASIRSWRPAGLTAEDSFAVVIQPPSAPPARETVVEMVMRFSLVVARVSVWGGPAVTLASSSAVGDGGAARFRGACSQYLSR